MPIPWVGQARAGSGARILNLASSKATSSFCLPHPYHPQVFWHLQHRLLFATLWRTLPQGSKRTALVREDFALWLTSANARTEEHPVSVHSRSVLVLHERVRVMSRNGSSIGYYQTVSVMHPAAGPSRGSAGSTNGGSPFYPSSVLPTSRRERDGAPSLPQPGSIPRSQQHHHINSPDAAFHAAHLMPGPHTLHSNGSSSSMLQHPASEGGLNNEMTSQGSNQQAHHSNQVYHADFTDFSGPQSATPYHARELGESQTQPDLSMRHGNMQPSPRSYSQAEFGDSMGAPATPKHGALQAPSNAELARAIESLGSTLGGQVSRL